LKAKVEPISLPLKSPFAITGHVFENLEGVVVTLEEDGLSGRGEADGVYYLGQNQQWMLNTLTEFFEAEKKVNREDLQQLLPANAARNAVDCALWDLEAKKHGVSVWELLNLSPKKLQTVATVGISSPAEMAAKAIEFKDFQNLKIKLDENEPVIALEQIRKARPHANIIIDVNQGWSMEMLKDFTRHLEKLEISMIEQPLPVGEDEQLIDYKGEIPLGADESCLSTAEYESIKRYYQVINIKLDKTGGLTEAIKLARLALGDKKQLMVGNMTGSSLAMAPAYVIGQWAEFVDIDGPVLLAKDVRNGLSYDPSGVSIPKPELWG
jgi:L-alanine-DL-glutamate epimerase-like enolase superfamily enzyme